MEIYWFEQSAAGLPAADDWLSSLELTTLATLRFAKRRDDWRLGRWTAKQAIAAVLKLPARPHALRDIVITAAPTGEPQVPSFGPEHDISISISHRDGRAACAVALGTVPLGCDLELVEPKSDAFVADYFTTEEQLLVARAVSSAQPFLTSLLWSAKESTLKALHVGLRADTRSVSVHPDRLDNPNAVGPDWRPLRVRCASGMDFSGWWRCRNRIVNTLVAAPAPLRPIELDDPQLLSLNS